MAQFLHNNLSNVLRKWGSIILALSWFFGLLSGVSMFHEAGTSLVSLMPMTVSCRLSIVGLLSSAFLPFLFSAMAVYLLQPILLIAVCFCKAFCFAFVSCGAFAAFGSAGWLVWLLLMSHDIAVSALLYLYCLRHISGSRTFSYRETGAIAAVISLISGLGYSVISPFLTGLLTF